MLATKEDLVFPALDTKDRSTDCLVIVELDWTHFTDHKELATKLIAATLRIKNKMPKERQILVGKRWVDRDNVNGTLDTVICNNIHDAIETWINQPLNISNCFWSQKLFIDEVSHNISYSLRAHHSFSDGISMSSIAEAILFDALSPTKSKITLNEPVSTLKFEDKKPKNPFVPSSYVQPITKDGKISGSRRYHSIDLHGGALTNMPEEVGNVGLNNYIISSCLLGLKNADIATSQDYGVCIPVSIRQKGSHGVGNGASRIVLFDKPGANIYDLALHFKKQLSWNYKNGGWHFPDIPIKWLPIFLFNLLIKLSMRIKRAHRGSFIFTGFDGTSVKSNVSGVKDAICIGPLTRNYSLILSPVYFPDKINLIATYNDGCFTKEEIKHLLQCISKTFHRNIRNST